VTGFDDLYRLLTGLARCNEFSGFTKRGRREGARQKIEKDAAAIAWGVAEAERTGCRDPYALAARVPFDVLRQIGAHKKRFETNRQRIGDKLKIALSKLSIPD
jgi:hypothetical protein